MSRLLLDTHSWTWTMEDGSRLSARARTAINDADQILLCPGSFYEIGQKVRLGK